MRHRSLGTLARAEDHLSGSQAWVALKIRLGCWVFGILSVHHFFSTSACSFFKSRTRSWNSEEHYAGYQRLWQSLWHGSGTFCRGQDEHTGQLGYCNLDLIFVWFARLELLITWLQKWLIRHIIMTTQLIGGPSECSCLTPGALSRTSTGFFLNFLSWVEFRFFFWPHLNRSVFSLSDFHGT